MRQGGLMPNDLSGAVRRALEGGALRDKALVLQADPYEAGC